MSKLNPEVGDEFYSCYVDDDFHVVINTWCVTKIRVRRRLATMQATSYVHMIRKNEFTWKVNKKTGEGAWTDMITRDDRKKISLEEFPKNADVFPSILTAYKAELKSFTDHPEYFQDDEDKEYYERAVKNLHRLITREQNKRKKN